MTSFYNIFIGCETGLLKGIDVEQHTSSNVVSVEQANKENEIVKLCWNDDDQNEVCLGRRSQTVSIYDRTTNATVNTLDFSGGEGPFKGLCKVDRDYITCTECGRLRLWSPSGQQKCEILVGGSVCIMRNNPQQRHLVATGGKENKLKLWDLDRPDAPVFTAKNVRNDWLNLRVPEWVTDVTFIPDSQRIVTSTNDHEVRVYDPSSHCRRPVVSILFDESRITSMCLRPNNPHQVFVGNVHGGMALIDLRAKGKVVQHYKGAEGSIRDVCCHPSQNVVASCGLDRFLRIHDIDSREVLHKFYLKSRANAMLYSDKSRPVDSTTENTSAVTEMLSDEDTDDKLVQHRDNNDEELWAKMAPVPTTEAKQKVASKRQKGLTDDATVDKIDTASNERHNKKRSRQSSRKSAKLQKKNLALSEDGS